MSGIPSDLTQKIRNHCSEYILSGTMALEDYSSLYWLKLFESLSQYLRFDEVGYDFYQISKSNLEDFLQRIDEACESKSMLELCVRVLEIGIEKAHLDAHHVNVYYEFLNIHNGNVRTYLEEKLGAKYTEMQLTEILTKLETQSMQITNVSELNPNLELGRPQNSNVFMLPLLPGFNTLKEKS